MATDDDCRGKDKTLGERYVQPPGTPGNPIRLGGRRPEPEPRKTPGPSGPPECPFCHRRGCVRPLSDHPNVRPEASPEPDPGDGGKVERCSCEEAEVYKAALEKIRDGLADDRAYRTTAREALRAVQ